MSMAEIRLYETLKATMGAKEAEAFVEIVDQKVDQRVEMMKEGLATKTDLSDVRKEMSDMRAELTKLIYRTSLGQLLAIIMSVITLVLLLKK
jgi:hypothetical protein